MSRIDLLRKNYQRICGLPWDRHVAGPQRVWLAVYDKEDERKLRLRLGLFEEATQQAGHHWDHFDLTDAFANWLCESALFVTTRRATSSRRTALGRRAARPRSRRR